jgi:hypothetical protein
MPIEAGLTTENYTWTPPGDIPLGIFWINLEGSSAEDFQVVNLVARSTASSSAPSELSAVCIPPSRGEDFSVG